MVREKNRICFDVKLTGNPLASTKKNPPAAGGRRICESEPDLALHFGDPALKREADLFQDPRDHRGVGGLELLPGGHVTKDDLRAHPVGPDLEALKVAVRLLQLAPPVDQHGQILHHGDALLQGQLRLRCRLLHRDFHSSCCRLIVLHYLHRCSFLADCLPEFLCCTGHKVSPLPCGFVLESGAPVIQ